MAYCPVCKHQFEDAQECPNDKVALVDELPYLTVDADKMTWVDITSVGSLEEAKMIQGFLESEGIPTQLESLELNALPVNFGGIGEIRIYVDATREADALRLLEDREEQYDSMASDGSSVMTDEGAAEIAADAEYVAEDEPAGEK